VGMSNVPPFQTYVYPICQCTIVGYYFSVNYKDTNLLGSSKTLAIEDFDQKESKCHNRKSPNKYHTNMFSLTIDNTTSIRWYRKKTLFLYNLIKL
jgi:hypothetical protein